MDHVRFTCYSGLIFLFESGKASSWNRSAAVSVMLTFFSEVNIRVNNVITCMDLSWFIPFDLPAKSVSSDQQWAAGHEGNVTETSECSKCQTLHIVVRLHNT